MRGGSAPLVGCLAAPDDLLLAPIPIMGPRFRVTLPPLFRILPPPLLRITPPLACNPAKALREMLEVCKCGEM